MGHFCLEKISNLAIKSVLYGYLHYFRMKATSEEKKEW